MRSKTDSAYTVYFHLKSLKTNFDKNLRAKAHVHANQARALKKFPGPEALCPNLPSPAVKATITDNKNKFLLFSDFETSC